MGSIVKITIILASLVLVGTAISLYVGNQYSDEINNDIIYFLSTMGVLSFIGIPMTAVFNCMIILTNFIIALMMFIVIHWIVRIVSK